jgi:hypothetical protein
MGKRKRSSKQCRNAMIHVTKAYDQRLSNLEDRLDSIVTVLNGDQINDVYDVVGDSMAILSLMKKQIKTKEEILNERGLSRIISEIEDFKSSESIIMDGGDLEGEVATVYHGQDNTNDDEIAVKIEFDYDTSLDQDSLPVDELQILRRDSEFRITLMKMMIEQFVQ